MTIIWCGAEDIDFRASDQEITTSSSNMDSVFSRCALYMAEGQTSEVWIQFTEIAIVDYLWVGFRLESGASIVSAVSIFSLGLYQASIPILLRTGPSGSTTKLELVINGVVQGITADTVLTQDCKIDIEVSNFSSESEGTVKVYINALEAMSYTGILGNEIETGLRCLRFRSSSTNLIWYLSQVIVADEDTRLLSVKTLAPNAAGDTNQWSGAYTDIDEVELNIADALRTQEADKLFTTNLTGLPSGKWAIRAVKVAVASSPAKDGLGLQVGLKTNDEVHLGDSVIPAFEYDNPIYKMFQVNPVTSEPFTMEEIEALQIAIKSVDIS